MPIVKVNDINMYYEIQGEGEPLLLIGGWGSELTLWSSIASGLAKKYQVISFDNRGAGRTDKPDIPYSIEMMAEDTIGLMNTLGIKSAHFLGISMGGHISQTIAVKYPEKVKSLILNVSMAHYPDEFKSIPDEVMLKDTGVVFTQKYPPTPESFIRQNNGQKNFDNRKRLSQIKAPTIIVNAKEDPIVSMELTKELAEGIKGSKLVLVEGDHFFAIMKPELLVNPVLEFLEELDDKSDLEVKSAI